MTYLKLLYFVPLVVGDIWALYKSWKHGKEIISYPLSGYNVFGLLVFVHIGICTFIGLMEIMK